MIERDLLLEQHEIQKKLSAIYNDEMINAEKQRLRFQVWRDAADKKAAKFLAEYWSGYPNQTNEAETE